MNLSKRFAASALVLACFGIAALGSKKKDDVKVTKGDKEESEDEAKDSKKEKKEKKEKKSDEEKAVAKVGDKVEFEDSAWVVTEVKDIGKELKASNSFVKPKKTEGRFVMVKFKVTNKGKKEANVLEHPKVMDAKGREFGNFDQQMMYLPDDLKTMILESLQPDITKTFAAIYELPEDAKSLKFQAKELELFGSKKALIDLGL